MSNAVFFPVATGTSSHSRRCALSDEQFKLRRERVLDADCRTNDAHVSTGAVFGPLDRCRDC